MPYEERPRTEAANKPPQVSRFDLLAAFLKIGLMASAEWLLTRGA